MKSQYRSDEGMVMIEGDEALIIGGDKAYLVSPSQNIEGDVSPPSPPLATPLPIALLYSDTAVGYGPALLYTP